MEIDFKTIDSFELDGYLILLKLNASRVHVLNPLASMIWQFKKTGLSDCKIASEMSEAFNIPKELALQDIKSIYAQWLLELAVPVEGVIPQQQQLSLPTELSGWLGEVSIYLSFSNCKVRVDFDSHVLAEKVKKLFSFSDILDKRDVNYQLDIISDSAAFLIVKDEYILDQVEAESHAAQRVFHHIVDLVCKHDDWLLILHAGGVCWQEQGIIFPALGGSGKTTLTAALIKDGFQYINDDVIPLIRHTGELVCLSTCLSIKSGSWSILQSRYPALKDLEVFGHQQSKVKYLKPSPDLIFEERLQQKIYAKHIVLPSYQTGAEAWLEPLSSVSALQAIIEGESLLRLPLDKQDIVALIKWIEPLTCHRLTYDKLDSAVALLREFVFPIKRVN